MEKSNIAHSKTKKHTHFDLLQVDAQAFELVGPVVDEALASYPQARTREISYISGQVVWLVPLRPWTAKMLVEVSDNSQNKQAYGQISTHTTSAFRQQDGTAPEAQKPAGQYT